MPYPAPLALSDDDTYAVVAYILNLNGIVPDGATLNRASLTAIRMPNRDGFRPDAEFRSIHNARQPWCILPMSDTRPTPADRDRSLTEGDA